MASASSQSMHACYHQTPTFLADPGWIEVITSTISADSKDVFRSRYAILFFIYGAWLGGLFQSCTSFFLHTTYVEQQSQRKSLLEKVGVAMKKMREGHKKMIACEPPFCDAASMPLECYNHIAWRLYTDTALLKLFFHNRLYIALGGGIHADAANIEETTREAAGALLELYLGQIRTFAERSCAALIIPGCRAIMETSEDWLRYIRDSERDASSISSIPGETYVVWMRLSGFRGL